MRKIEKTHIERKEEFETKILKISNEFNHTWYKEVETSDESFTRTTYNYIHEPKDIYDGDWQVYYIGVNISLMEDTKTGSKSYDIGSLHLDVSDNGKPNHVLPRIEEKKALSEILEFIRGIAKLDENITKVLEWMCR